METKKSLMFKFINRTWNPVTGCKHNCVYCWARVLCKRFNWSFEPTFHENRLNKMFRENEIVFVSDMGDLFGAWVPREWILKVFSVIAKNPRTTFFLESKNPKRFIEFKFGIPKNTILSTTIETNRAYRVSFAPLPIERYQAMREVDGIKHVSIEPIMDFDEEIFLNWLSKIEPKFVSIGYDNYGFKLPDPPIEKTLKFIEDLDEIGILIEIKNLKGHENIPIKNKLDEHRIQDLLNLFVKPSYSSKLVTLLSSS